MATREYMLKRGVYVSESGTRDEMLVPGIYLSETVAVTDYAAFSTPQDAGRRVMRVIGY